MPELPEVETIRIGLTAKIIGLKIQKVEVLNPKSFSPGNTEEGIKQVEGQTITGVWRRAKVLGIVLGPSKLTLIFHLKMSGQVIFDDGTGRFSGGHPTQDMKLEMPNKSTRVIFELSKNCKIYFNDQRKFGWIKVLTLEQIEDLPFLKSLGPEPLEAEFNWQTLKKQLLKRANQPVKVVLLDQQIVAGVGNIYAAEACFLAKIHPTKKVKELTDNEFKKLYEGLVKTLSDGILYGGSSRQHYLNSDGGKGGFLDYAFVYGRVSQLCRVCSLPIAKIKLGGRGTFFCPKCQKE